MQGLHVMDRVEDDLTLVHRDGEIDEVTARRVAPPYPKLQVVGHLVLLLE